MSFKDVLVYLDGFEGTEATMQSAAQFASQHKAKLTGLHVIGYPLPSQTGVYFDSTRGSLSSTETLAMIRESALATARRAEAVFLKHLRAEELIGDWRTAEGMVAYTASVAARSFDLTIVGQIDAAHPPLGSRKLVPEALLLESGRPVLIIPFRGQHAKIGTRVLIAWDGSREATRALNDAVPLLEKAALVAVVTLRQTGGDTAATCADPTVVVSHVAQHGIQAEALHRQVKGERVAKALMRYAAEMKADLLVMGGYGHSRLHEIIVGGTTRGVLRNMTIPVLMSH